MNINMVNQLLNSHLSLLQFHLHFLFPRIHPVTFIRMMIYHLATPIPARGSFHCINLTFQIFHFLRGRLVASLLTHFKSSISAFLSAHFLQLTIILFAGNLNTLTFCAHITSHIIEPINNLTDTFPVNHRLMHVTILHSLYMRIRQLL